MCLGRLKILLMAHLKACWPNRTNGLASSNSNGHSSLRIHYKMESKLNLVRCANGRVSSQILWVAVATAHNRANQLRLPYTSFAKFCHFDFPIAVYFVISLDAKRQTQCFHFFPKLCVCAWVSVCGYVFVVWIWGTIFIMIITILWILHEKCFLRFEVFVFVIIVIITQTGGIFLILSHFKNSWQAPSNGTTFIHVHV